MSLAIGIFALSVVGIALLFLLKHWEIQRGRMLMPSIRARLDAHALLLKSLLFAARADLEKLPPEAIRISRIVIHEAALGLAATARFAERQAHRLADLVSYKHRFEKRNTRSEFLKKVSEHKNGERQSETGDVSSEQNGSAR